MKEWFERIEYYLKSSKPVSTGEDVVDSIVMYAILALLIIALL